MVSGEKDTHTDTCVHVHTHTDSPMHTGGFETCTFARHSAVDECTMILCGCT
jgi:hypothetical protein